MFNSNNKNLNLLISNILTEKDPDEIKKEYDLNIIAKGELLRRRSEIVQEMETENMTEIKCRSRIINVFKLEELTHDLPTSLENTTV